MQVLSLGQEDPLDEGMATHSSTLAWRIPWTEEPGRLQGHERVRHDSVTQQQLTRLEFVLLALLDGGKPTRRFSCDQCAAPGVFCYLWSP